VSDDNQDVNMYIYYRQTVGKTHPYLFSQCQAVSSIAIIIQNHKLTSLQIHARAFSPLMDTPNVKITYSASVTSPLPVVMSALLESTTDNGDNTKTYHFKQNTTIPSYLIAIAAGNLVGREIGPRSTVWCEPEVVEQAAWEFDVSS
jgi:hypothetical protein